MRIKHFYINEPMNEVVLLGEDGKLYHAALDDYFEALGENRELLSTTAFEIPFLFINNLED